MVVWVREHCFPSLAPDVSPTLGVLLLTLLAKLRKPVSQSRQDVWAYALLYAQLASATKFCRPAYKRLGETAVFPENSPGARKIPSTKMSSVRCMYARACYRREKSSEFNARNVLWEGMLPILFYFPWDQCRQVSRISPGAASDRNVARGLYLETMCPPSA